MGRQRGNGGMRKEEEEDDERQERERGREWEERSRVNREGDERVDVMEGRRERRREKE